MTGTHTGRLGSGGPWAVMEMCKQSGDSAAFLCIRPLVKAGELILIGRGVCVGKQSWDAVIRKEEAGVGNFCTH